MKKQLIVMLFLASVLMKGQICAPTWTPMAVVFPPNSTSTFSVWPSPFYLCGPNTVVYDTLNPGNSCRYGYINAGCTYYFKTNTTGVCSGHAFAIKNGGTLVLLGSTPVNVLVEPGATVLNWTVFPPVPVTTITCANIVTPSVNCVSATSINNVKLSANNVFKCWPNPSASTINIELLNSNESSADVTIMNQLGQIVWQQKDWLLSNKTIDIDKLPNGNYSLHIKTKTQEYTDRVMINK